MPYDINKLRKQITEKKSNFRDSNEFVPPKVKPGEEKNFRFFILPPLNKGDKTADGVASRDMNDTYYVQNGAHWINRRPHSCPRVCDDAECEMCNYGFELMGEVQGDGKVAKDQKSKIAKSYLPPQRFAINIFFTADSTNPEELRGKVMWMNAPATLIKMGEECLMREDAGDEGDPKPFGIFFDENNAYLFQLTVKEKSSYNNYETSKFLPNIRRPIMKNADGTPNPTAIKKVLDSRHDLFTKFAPADPAKISSLLKGMLEKQEGGGGDAGFNEDEGSTSAPTSKGGGHVVSEDLVGEGPAESAPKTVTKPAATKPAAAPPKTATVPKTATKPTPVVKAPEPTPPPAEEAGDGAVEEDGDAELAALMGDLNKEE